MYRFGEANGPSIVAHPQKCSTYSSLCIFSDLGGAENGSESEKGHGMLYI